MNPVQINRTQNMLKYMANKMPSARNSDDPLKSIIIRRNRIFRNIS